MRILVRGLFFIACVVFARPAFALTAAGVVITNTSSVTFTDNSVSYTAASNTLTITVQNAAVMTITPPTGISVTPAYKAIDTFTFTNAGNASGLFQMTGDATFAGGTTTPTLKGYILNNGAGTCTQAVLCTVTQLNTALNLLPPSVMTTGSVTVAVEYQVSTAAAPAATVKPLIGATITYPTGSNLSAMTSPTATYAVYSDTVIADARLDVQASAVINTTVSITWTVKANTNGGFAAQGLQSVKTMLGAGANGVAIFMQVPYFAGNTQYQTLTTTPAAVTLSAGVTGISTTATWYYNATPCSSSPTTGWSTTYSASSECLAVYLTNAGATVLPLATGGSTGAGTVGTPQITAIFTTTQPSGGSGSGNVGSVNLVASSAIGGDPWMTTASPQPIVGAPLAVGASQDAATASLLSTIESTSTPSSGTTPPGGASNQAQANAQSSYSVFVGPNGSPQATGNWSTATYGYTTGSLTNNNDFTFVSYDTAASINTATNQASFPAGNSIAAASVVAIIGSVQNSGNAVDTITLSSTSNANWTVAFNCYNLSLNSCGASSGAAGTCSTVALPSSQAQNLASQATLKFCAAFTPSAALTALSAIVWTITGTSVGNGTVNNTTYDAVYPGGVLVGFRTYVVSACPGGVTPANQGVISGCTITYTAYLVNEAPTPGAGGSVSVTPSVSAVITENGTATWGVNTGGLTVAPTVASCALCTFTTITLGSKSFTVTVPIADLAPQARPSYTYSVLVN